MAFCTKCGGANDPSALFCKTCGASLIAAATTTGSPPPPVAPIVVVKKGGAGKVLLIVIAVLVGLGVMGSVIAHLTGADKKEIDPCDDSSYSYLFGLKRGDANYSAGYWKPTVTPQNLIDVHSFKYVAHGPALMANGKPYKIPRTYYQYEVESSNAGGMPIRKRWNVVMEHDTVGVAGKPCAIVAVQP